MTAKQFDKLCFKFVHGDGPQNLCSMMFPPISPVRHTGLSASSPPIVLWIGSNMVAKGIGYRAPLHLGNTEPEINACKKCLPRKPR